MAVGITATLRRELEAAKAALTTTDPQLAAKFPSPLRLLADFEAWKAGGAAAEYDSPVFGKDGAYADPAVNGQRYKLRHVHLPPMGDPEGLKKWNAAWRRRGRKVSDRALVYCEDGADYLLIFILPEPDAHEIARMATPEDRHSMEAFARIAAAFIERREIIA